MERRLKGGGHELCAKGMNTNSHFQFSNRLAFFSFHLTACSPEAASIQQASLGSSQIAGEQWCEQKYRGSVLHTSCHISAARTGCLMIQPTVWTRENTKKLLFEQLVYFAIIEKTQQKSQQNRRYLSFFLSEFLDISYDICFQRQKN